MSVGLLCSCPHRPHQIHRPTLEFGGCGAYSVDQEAGGPCAPCLIGHHSPCERVVVPTAVGTCPDCLWHVSTHHGYRPPK